MPMTREERDDHCEGMGHALAIWRNWLSARHDSWTDWRAHFWVDFSWPRPRDSLGGHFVGGAMMEGTHVMMMWLGDRVH